MLSQNLQNRCRNPWRSFRILFFQMPGQERYANPPVETQKLIPLHASFLQNFAFLSPEQTRLDPAFAVDAKTDAYAFGVLVYYLLMGEFPMGIFDCPQLLVPI